MIQNSIQKQAKTGGNAEVVDRVEPLPLITFALFAFNQERFIREAIEGALSQSYSPLEVILSDDQSSDSTFTIMKEMASAYDGPHKIILNQNEKNLGIGGHINKLVEMSSGEFFVIAAGDDISLSNRTSVLVETWLSDKKGCKSIYSNAIRIDEKGAFIANHSREYNRDFTRNIISHDHITGATHGWDRQVFDFFGPLNPDVVNEDVVIPIRSKLLGGVVHLSDQLVKYRKCESIWMSVVRENPHEKVYHARKNFVLPIYKQILKDLRTFKAKKNCGTEIDGYEKLTENIVEQLKYFLEFLEMGLFKNLLAVFSVDRSNPNKMVAYRRYFKFKFPFIRVLIRSPNKKNLAK